MWPFKKKINSLNNTILLRWRHEALGRLRFYGVYGGWSGYFETTICGITYRGERVSGFRAVTGNVGTFIQDALIDRARLAKNPGKYSEQIAMTMYGCKRLVREDGTVEQWNG